MASDTFLYLTTRGRKTGLARQIEIWFVSHQGRYYLAAEMRERAGWVRNLLAHSRVEISVGTRNDKQSELTATSATARVLDEHAEPALAAQIKALLRSKYDWDDALLVEIAPDP